jgi:hypothetical protein
VVKEYDPASTEACQYRAVVIVQERRDEKRGHQYADPLMVLSGEEYARTPFQELLDRIHRAMGWDERLAVLSWTQACMKVLRGDE